MARLLPWSGVGCHLGAQRPNISLPLMEGANTRQIANNRRTSVQMIEAFFAAHIKDRLDASSVNVMRTRPVRLAARKPAAKRPEA